MRSSNQGASSGRLTVALHATAALTAVSSAKVAFEEGEAPLRSHTVTERARAFQACQSTTFPENQKRAAGWNSLVNRYFPTLRLAPPEAPRPAALLPLAVRAPRPLSRAHNHAGAPLVRRGGVESGVDAPGPRPPAHSPPGVKILTL